MPELSPETTSLGPESASFGPRSAELGKKIGPTLPGVAAKSGRLWLAIVQIWAISGGGMIMVPQRNLSSVVVALDRRRSWHRHCRSLGVKQPIGSPPPMRPPQPMTTPGDPCELRSCHEIVEHCSGSRDSAQIRPLWAELGQTLADLCQTRPESHQIWPMLTQCRAASVKSWPTSTPIWPNNANFGGGVGQHLCDFARTWPSLRRISAPRLQEQFWGNCRTTSELVGVGGSTFFGAYGE